MNLSDPKILLCVIFVSLGVLSWIITIGARISSKKTGHFVSGVPALGGIFIAVGFLFSPIKWLALIGLLDFDLWYLIISVIPSIIIGEKALRDYIPPEVFDGGKVLEYSDYNKEFEEIREDIADGAMMIHHINRYVIISKDNSFILLKTEINARIIQRIECKSPEECKIHASSKARWKHL